MVSISSSSSEQRDEPETARLTRDSVAMGIDANVALTLVGVTAVPCDNALRPFLSSMVITPPVIPSTSHINDPRNVTASASLPSFNRQLKTFLFTKSFSSL